MPLGSGGGGGGGVSNVSSQWISCTYYFNIAVAEIDTTQTIDVADCNPVVITPFIFVIFTSANSSTLRNYGSGRVGSWNPKPEPS